ncbi:hypothetical protein [Noviherbaspirillum galbum]|uniref:Uncharacterized protein n=1 Tax=Noviherbaspirillum galbum TaxID=2709383 RepID=A0A6B3SXE2_9BURK|nr:hypothetical protein [Noviherbaspirillum galbum]NEX64215.1 hypothetical protein [Noviherbaspirillum galbum]
MSIFQLRLKLELLTHGRMTLVSVYKQGYCLRHKRGDDPLVELEEGGMLFAA